MSKLLFFISLYFLPAIIIAQAQVNLVGKWEITAVNNGVNYNYKTNSYSVSPKLLDSLRGKKDSAEWVGVLLGYAKDFSDRYFNFDKEGNFQEIKGSKIIEEGVYKVDMNKYIIDLIVKKGLLKITTHCNFVFKGENMKLSMLSPYSESVWIEINLDRLQK